MPRNDEQGRERDRETGSGGAAGFFNGGHDRTGNWPGTREDQGRDSRNYERSAYGERRDEHGTFGSRERPREYEQQGGAGARGGAEDHRGEGGYGRQQSPGQRSQPGYGSSAYGGRPDEGQRNDWQSGSSQGSGPRGQQGGDPGSHRGQPYGQDMERGYRSSEYGGERGGYSSDYGRGGSYGGGIHERDQWGQGREGQYTQAGDQDRGRYGQQATPRGQNEWGREPGHRSGQQGGYGGMHDWSAERPRTEWSGPQDEPNRHRDWGRDWARESGPFNPGGFGSANRSGPDNAQPRGYGEGGFAGMGSAQGYGREGTFGQWQSGQGPSWPGSGYGRTGDGGGSQQTGGMQGGASGGGAFGGAQARRRGPKNYQRSDERLRELISDRLLEDPHIDSSEVSVEVKDGEVTLTGTVDDRRTKYQIEELVEQIHGVRDVDNRVRVKRGFLANLFGTGDDDGERPRERSSGSESSQAGMTTSGSGSQTAASPTTSTTSPLGSTLSGGATTPGGTSGGTGASRGSGGSGGSSSGLGGSSVNSGAAELAGGTGSQTGGTSATGGTTSASGVGTEKGAGSTGTERGTAADRDPKRTR